MSPSVARKTTNALDPAPSMMEGGRMAIRKTKASAPTTTQPLTAGEVPVTRVMLESVRTEVLQRIDKSREEAKADAQRIHDKLDRKIDTVKGELKAEIQEFRTELKAEIQEVRTELKAEIQEVRTELKAEIQEVRTEVQGVKAEVRELKAEIHDIKAVVHATQAQVARIELLVEEQNARNKIVLDGITAILSRQEQVEQRISNVEDTVRALAAARPAADPSP
jgi:chromosome segregation ATPase